ncbi:MAG TPA: YdcF family protein [Pyrinomonadaceae bacterium]|jgi:vancomycin permeability regulator SanA
MFRKILFKSLTVFLTIFLAFAIYAAYQFTTIRLGNTTTEAAQSDCLVVLGAAVWENGQPSPVLNDRLARAAELYHSGVARKIIVSGGLGKHPPAEAEAGRIFLVNAKVNEADIILEMGGMTTAEQAERVKEICERENFKTIALVTSFFHERRAIQIFNNAGFSGVRDARCTHTRFQDINWWVFRESIALAAMNWLTWSGVGLASGLFFIWYRSGRKTTIRRGFKK